MSAEKSIPNPAWVSAPYEASGLGTMKSILNHRHFTEEQLGKPLELEIKPDGGTGLFWYHLKEV